MDLIEQVKSKMIEYNGKDIKRISHALKVHSFARYIAECEGIEPSLMQTIEIAALLHDIGIHAAEEKHGSSDGKYQEIEGPAVAHELMSHLEISDAEKARVEYLISRHHTYDNIENEALDYLILVEADFAVNIDENSVSDDAVRNALGHVIRTETATNLIKQLYC